MQVLFTILGIIAGIAGFTMAQDRVPGATGLAIGAGLCFVAAAIVEAAKIWASGQPAGYAEEEDDEEAEENGEEDWEDEGEPEED